MIGLIQRVSNAEISIDQQVTAKINEGILLLLGIEKEDGQKELEKLVKKVLQYRIFEDEAQKMNLSIQDIQGELLIVSQFTLAANTKKGNRPSFDSAMPPKEAEIIYDEFCTRAKQLYHRVATGTFGADMKVSLLNNGPVTFYLST